MRSTKIGVPTDAADLAATAKAADPTIIVRDRRFSRQQLSARWWVGGDPFATAVFNSLSLSFPRGEAYFIESVRVFRDDVDEPLASEIRAFIAQEVNHSREHLAFNRAVADAGYDTKGLDAVIAAVLGEARNRPPIVSLAATMALEHFTAMFAHLLLVDRSILANADPALADMWRWHAIEEIEHKAVAYDTWLHATKDWPRLRRWKVKALLMLVCTRNFMMLRYQGAIELLRQDGITGWRAHWGVLRYAFGKPGMVRRIASEWIAYFLPGFHPWNRDDRALIENAG
ncbi:metal-dependent hydrolase [Croceicoccus bisphenolivorans]|uniref:metal-dependent hydrolase n=1 Tax=Croceicoccus bisphenolivorans TaxID=1783232 RepID=UPI003CCBFC7B